jgi:CHAT domain-containing protein
MFPKGKQEVLTGRAANEDAFKALPLEDFRIIHFACHGLLDENHPLRSALVLSHNAEDKNDGLLQMREVYSLKTQADLVVLSACQTAGGALEQREGPMGITRAFFFSGAKAVLSTLWPVSDRAAAYLMREFYGNYLQGQSLDEALRAAKIKMLRTAWAHPYYWAALMLHGRSSTHPVSMDMN